MRHTTGFTLIELMIVVAIIGIIAAITVPGLMRARMSGNEASAIGSLRVINSGQTSYSTSCATGGYAVDLADLAKPPAGSNQAFVSPDLKSNGVTKSGYVISLAAEAGALLISSPGATCNLSVGQPMSAYWSAATAVTKGTTGTRAFATDTRGTIFQDTTLAQGADLANPIVTTVTTVPVQ